MKVSIKRVLTISILLFILNNYISIPKVFAPPPPTPPDQFISEIFPNRTLPLQLLNSDTIIKFNATQFPDKIDIHFDANYTINNLENTTTISLIVPFSLDINISKSIIEVYTNNTEIPYRLFTVSPWNENLTAIDTNLPGFIERYPITLIKTNVTLIMNSSSVIRYNIKCTVFNPLDPVVPFFMIYHLGTFQEWIGNTSGRLELRTYGKQPIFSKIGFLYLTKYDVVDINGGTVAMCQWNNSQIPNGGIGVVYYGNRDDGFLIVIFVNMSITIGIAIIIILIIIIRKNRRKIKIVN